MMRYQFLLDTYETERLKVVSVWSFFRDAELSVRPHPTDTRGRSVLEQMIHQCISEDNWFKNFFGIDVGAPPLPATQDRRGFITRYWEDSGRRLAALRARDEAFWEQEVPFFDVRPRPRLDHGPPHRPHRPPSRAADGPAAHAEPRGL